MHQSILQFVMISITNYSQLIKACMFLFISLSLLNFGLIISKHIYPDPDVGSGTIILHSHDIPV